MNLKEIWNSIVTFFKSNVWNIVLFFAVLFIGIIFIKVCVLILKKILNKTKCESITVSFICGIIKVIFYLMLTLILMNIIGIEITGVLTAISALILAIGLALQNNIANMANGIIIVSSKMFKKGDCIQVNGYEGNITKINFLYTTLTTSDNKKITLPNSMIVNSAVVDYDANYTRMVEFKIAVAYESDVEKVKQIIIDSMKSNGKVLLDPPLFCRMASIDSSSLGFIARCWCDKEDYWNVYYDVFETIFNELKRNNITIPYNQLEIRERKDVPIVAIKYNKLPRRIEKARKESLNGENEINFLREKENNITKKR